MNDFIDFSKLFVKFLPHSDMKYTDDDSSSRFSTVSATAFIIFPISLSLSTSEEDRTILIQIN